MDSPNRLVQSPANAPPQIQRQRKFARNLFGRRIDGSGSMPVILESCQPARLGFVGIHWKGVVVAPPGMGDVIDATAKRAAIPQIDEIEGQWRVHRNRRMQARGGLPGLETN